MELWFKGIGLRSQRLWQLGPYWSILPRCRELWFWERSDVSDSEKSVQLFILYTVWHRSGSVPVQLWQNLWIYESSDKFQRWWTISCLWWLFNHFWTRNTWLMDPSMVLWMTSCCLQLKACYLNARWRPIDWRMVKVAKHTPINIIIIIVHQPLFPEPSPPPYNTLTVVYLLITLFS